MTQLSKMTAYHITPLDAETVAVTLAGNTGSPWTEYERETLRRAVSDVSAVADVDRQTVALLPRRAMWSLRLNHGLRCFDKIIDPDDGFWHVGPERPVRTPAVFRRRMKGRPEAAIDELLAHLCGEVTWAEASLDLRELDNAKLIDLLRAFRADEADAKLRSRREIPLGEQARLSRRVERSAR